MRGKQKVVHHNSPSGVAESRTCCARVLRLSAAVFAVATFFVATASGSGTVSQLTHTSYSSAVSISPDGNLAGYNDDFDRSWPPSGYSLNLEDGSQSTFPSLPVFSYDGRYLAYVDDSGVTGTDVYWKDMSTGSVLIVSADSSGVPGNGPSASPAISWDGRYVAFESEASNLVPGDTNGRQDIYLKDIITGAVSRVSTDTAGAQGTGGSSYSYDGAWAPSLSADGRYIAFESIFTNLVANDTNARMDVFLKDTLTGATTRMSTDSSGGQGVPFYSYYRSGAGAPSISSDGRYVAFHADFANLVPGDINGWTDIFVKDTLTGSTSLVSAESDGTQMTHGGHFPSITADGRYIVFDSWSESGVTFKDTQTGALEQFNTMVDGCNDETGCHSPSGFIPEVSADGRYIVFMGEDWHWMNSVYLAATSLCTDNTRPVLTFALEKVYWASFQAYLDRDLSVDFTISNSGTEPAFSPEITGSQSTGGVTLNKALPHTLENIYAGGNTTVTLDYEIPMGARAFITTTNATALDACGNSHSYP